jgi:Mor family transcriptional regulator
MAPYSMDLLKSVARAWDAGMDGESIAAKYEVSRAWVHRLIQRRSTRHRSISGVIAIPLGG